MEKVWRHLFDNELRATVKDHPVLIADSPLVPRSQRETAAEILFEKFQVPKLYMCNGSVLSLYASGETTGLVIDAGDTVTSAVPVIDGHAQRHAIMKTDVAGRDITAYLRSILAERGYNLEEEAVRITKQDLCYVALDFSEYSQSASNDFSLEKSYELPDGQNITIGNEGFRAPEALFQPSLLGKESQGIHELVHSSIMECQFDDRGALIRNVVMVRATNTRKFSVHGFVFANKYDWQSGGSTMFQGMGDRLSKELNALLPTNSRAKVITPPSREYGAWIGGSILASGGTLQQQWLSKEAYDEHGPKIVHRKYGN